MLCGNVQETITICSLAKVDDSCNNTPNNNGIGCSRRKSPHNSWWNSQSSSSRFSSPSYKSGSRGQINTNMGRGNILKLFVIYKDSNLLYIFDSTYTIYVKYTNYFSFLGRISRHDIISSPTPNNFAAEDDVDGHSNATHKKYDITRKNKKSRTCNIL